MHKLKHTVAITLLFTLLFTWAILNAAIAGEEVEHRVSTVAETVAKKLHKAKEPLIRIPDATISGGQNSDHVANISTNAAGQSTNNSGQMASIVDNGFEVHIDQYLAWHDTYPEGWARLLKWGRAFLMGDWANMPPLPLDPAMIESCYIAYEGARWDAWIDFRGCRNSPFYGRGVEIARYLRSRGRSVANCLATLEVESTFGLGGSCYFGILYGNYANTIEGYCALLADNGVGNDPWEQACFWNMPGYPTYQNGFCKVVRTIEGWYP